MLLNGGSLNGASLSGAPLVVTEGSAAFDASADFTASAVVIWAGQASPTGTAEVSPTATKIRPGTATLLGEALLVARAWNNHAASASPSGSASVYAFASNIQPGEAAFDCTGACEMLAQTSEEIFFQGTGDLSGEVTYVHSTARATFDCTGSLANSGVGITRYVEADFDCTGKLTASYRVLHSGAAIYYYYAGAEIDGTGELDIDPILVRFNQVALFDCTSPSLVANLTLEINSSTIQAANTADFVASGTIIRPGAAAMDGAGTVSATAIRNVLPTALPIAANAEFYAGAWQNFAATATFDYFSDLTIGETWYTIGGVIAIECSADMTAEVLYTHMGIAELDAGSEVLAYGTNLDKVQAEAYVDGTAEIYAEMVRILEGASSLGGTANFETYDPSFTFEHSDKVIPDLNFVDPPERTMYRTGVDRTMVRPFIDRTMKEAA